ncbi:hypothetical protein Gogos_020471 [Gossypium gossypioides]|uniref:Uncharacterized protein n=1 Tax=Gossypium gossypioides TaxID=34282 RepID=A0A7J9D377_GOSGO|nr:hypothetical protein [Gossypium gossypioides]
MFIQEHAFKPSNILCWEIWTLAQYNKWESFCVTPKDSVVVSVVQEFYASFRDEESRRPKGAKWERIPVRGKEVLVTLRAICEFHNAPYYESNFLEEIDLEYFRDTNMDNIINYLTEVDVNGNVTLMLIQFLCTRITPALKVSNVNTFRAILLYVVL